TITDEIRILHERLELVGQAQPQLDARLRRILTDCERLAAFVRPRAFAGIHRDFYPDQILVDGGRIYLLDLDLYCEGDPALDIGNFIAHLSEYSLRTYGDPARLAHLERAIYARFAELTDPSTLAAVDIYAQLSLVRHIHIS